MVQTVQGDMVFLNIQVTNQPLLVWSTASPNLPHPTPDLGSLLFYAYLFVY